MAAEDGGDVEPPDLPDGLCADDKVHGEPFVLNENKKTTSSTASLLGPKSARKRIR